MNNEKLIIVGCGDSGLELLSIILHESMYRSENIFFIDDCFDDDIREVFYFNQSFSVIDSIGKHSPSNEFRYICSITDQEVRHLIIDKLVDGGALFANIISSYSYIIETATLGLGCIISPNCYIANNAIVNDHVFLNYNTSIGHNAIIGRGTVISSHCDITGKVVVGENVYIGSSASIIPSVCVASGSTIGAGVCVIKNIKSKSLVFGLLPKILVKEELPV